MAKLLLYALPSTMPFALPLGVLVGILIGLSRMSADSEITAMRAAGISSVTIVRPVLLFSFLRLGVDRAASLWLTPLSLHLETKVARNFAAAQLTGEIESRIFNEQFPNTVLYVDDVTRGRQAGRFGTRFSWRIRRRPTSCSSRARTAAKDRASSLPEKRFRIPMQRTTASFSTCEMSAPARRDKEGKVITTAAPAQVEALQAQKQEDLQVNKTVQEMDTGPLYKRVYRRHDLSHEDYVDAAIELHQRFALPLACVLLALVGIPLGISSRKGGKSGGVCLTVAAGVPLLSGLHHSDWAGEEGQPAGSGRGLDSRRGVSIAGLLLLSRLEKPGDTRSCSGWFGALVRRACRIASQ